MRLVFLALAALNVGALVVVAMGTDRPLALRLGVAVVAVALLAYWTSGYRRGRFPLAGEPVEAAAVCLLLAVAPGEPFLPLFGLLFRSLYGNLPLALGRYALWSAALLGAHAPRGDEHIQADVARALGMAVAPCVMQSLRAALQRSEASERRLRSLVQHSADIMTVVGEDLLIRWQADSIRGILGHEPHELLGTPLLDLIHPDDRPVLDGYFVEAHGRPDFSRTLAFRLRHGDGDYRHVEVVAANRLHDHSVGGFVLNMRDATERLRMGLELHALAAEREHEALHDALTGLPNRRMLFDRLHVALERARGEQQELALMLIDLDHFKELNDTLGHHAGDQLLREMRPRLLESAPAVELVARLGGDEFAVLFSPGVPASELRNLANSVRAAIEQPFTFQGLMLPVKASVGIALYPRHADDVETLVQRADVAMYAAKRRGIGLEIYSPSRDDHSKERLELIAQLPEAIANGELVIHYQPKVDLRSGDISSVEALVRWAHPERGLLSPGVFLPLAEHIGVMRPLTLEVLDQALRDCAQWRADGLELEVAVNLSAPNLIDMALPLDIAAALRRWQLEPSCLNLEVTETLVAADPDRVGEVMEGLRDLGITLSLDDFGTGSSSLSYLRKLPVHELKIDKSFIADIEEDGRAGVILRTTIEMARILGLRTVAEGIETEAELARLTEYGCDQGQGYLLGRPMPADALVARLGATTRGCSPSGVQAAA